MVSAEQLRIQFGRWRTRLGRALTFPEDRTFLRQQLGAGVWTVDDYGAHADDAFSVSGWIATTVPDAVVLLNGQRPDTLHTGIRRPDLSPVFPYLPATPNLGFHAIYNNVNPDAPIELQLADASGRSIRPWQSVFVPTRSDDRWPLPDAARMRRVHGGAHDNTFRLVGFSNMRKIDGLLRAIGRNGYDDFPRILDWGCGCGRLLRYLTNLPHVQQLAGADIDRDNIAWCRANIPAADYTVLDLHPPSKLADQSFDLIIGISIFTHLTDAVQFEWLGELDRVLAPGGILIATIHGPAAQAMSGSPRLCRRVEAQGLISAKSYDLKDVLDDSSYYRTTYHSHAYVRREWSRYFDVQLIAEAAAGNAQDIVVMAKT